jgi:hypothetical protein
LPPGQLRSAGPATGGPPLKANAPLLSYPLRVRRGLLFIEVPLDTLTERRG